MTLLPRSYVPVANVARRRARGRATAASVAAVRTAGATQTVAVLQTGAAPLPAFAVAPHPRRDGIR